jgi:hypothetical protein
MDFGPSDLNKTDRNITHALEKSFIEKEVERRSSG